MKIQKNISLKEYSTLGIGGIAELFFCAKTPEKIISAVLWAKEKKLPITIFAYGSNVFFVKKKTNGLVVRVLGGKIKEKKQRYIVDSGVLLDSLIKKSLKDGYAGLESLTAIPGTVGGAVYGNAGAYGQSISDAVKRVQVFDGKRVFWMKKEECGFGYRESVFKKKKLYILRVEIILKKNNKRKALYTSKKIRLARKKKYPPTLKCPGSFFKNVFVENIPIRTMKKIDQLKIIEGKIPAGYLLESVGAKRMSVGGMRVADYNGNLFINKKNATARDVKTLALLLRRRVKKEFGITLEEEVMRL